MFKLKQSAFIPILFIPILLHLQSVSSLADLVLGPEEYIEANSTIIHVPGYSVPSFAFWDGDSLKDLIIGEGGGGFSEGKVRVYLNVGTAADPIFGTFTYAQSEGSTIIFPGSGCLGVFPRVVYWDEDDRKDLLIGLSDGIVKVYINTNTNNDPEFDGGTPLQVGEPGLKEDIDVGARATPTVADWNNDGRKDLVVGAFDGKLHLFINEGTDTSPDFRLEQFAQENGDYLVVPSARSSPVVTDLDNDSMKDLLTGNTDGQLFFYSNVGTDDAPTFSGYVFIESDGDSIDLAGEARSRPFVCDWSGDGLLDVLIGSGDGIVRLYQGEEEVGIESGEVSLTLPRSSHLLSAYPNPFNPSLTVPFELSEAEDIHLSVYDIRGRRVSILADRAYRAGRHQAVWQGKDDRGRSLPSGIYFLRFEAGEISETNKVNLVR